MVDRSKVTRLEYCIFIVNTERVRTEMVVIEKRYRVPIVMEINGPERGQHGGINITKSFTTQAANLLAVNDMFRMALNKIAS